MENDYYSIAVEDLKYLQHSMSYPGYNQIVVQAQQIAEKLLKSVAERVCIENVEGILKTRNLKKLLSSINAIDEFLSLNELELGYLKDFDYEAKYPGENFMIVTLQQCLKCLEIMYDILEQVNKFREGVELLSVSFNRVFPVDNEKN